MITRGLLALITAVPILLSGLSGCAAVKPYQRENLSDRSMDFEARKEEIAMEQHFLLTREGSMGGLGGAGGGCACN
jgi:hypothetical protein